MPGVRPCLAQVDRKPATLDRNGVSILGGPRLARAAPRVAWGGATTLQQPVMVVAWRRP